MTTHLAFQVEPFGAVWMELQTLVPHHWRELALDQDKVPLDPNWTRYAELEKANVISMVTARENGRLVGYAVMFLLHGLHYQTCYEATMDMFWLEPSVRGRMGGVRLFRTVEKELKRRGVQRVHLGSKLHQDVGPLFKRLGYTPVETWYSKMLTKETEPA